MIYGMSKRAAKERVEMFLLKGLKIVVFSAAILFMLQGITLAGIKVTPDIYIFELSQGEEKTVEYQIYNSGPQDIHMKIEPEDLAKVKENKEIKLSSWLIINEKGFVIKKNDVKKIPVYIKVPEEAVGELNSMIFLCYKESEESMINVRYGTPLYVLIKGTERIGAEIKSAGVCNMANPVTGMNNLIITVEMINQGNRHIKPKIWAVIGNEEDSNIQEIDLPKPWPIFGGRAHKYKIIWKDYRLDAGDYKAKVFIDYGMSSPLTYELVFNVDESGRITEESARESRE